MSTDIGRNYTSKIPSLSDDANIQEAFRMYHYGTEDGSEPAPGDSIAGIESWIASLQLQITNITSGTDVVNDLNDDADLDATIVSGTYRRASTPIAGRNYPESAAGLLKVTITPGDAVYQIYQTIGGSSGTNNYYWRGRNASGAWSSWSQASKVGHTHHSDYYQKTEIDARIEEQANLAASSVIVTDAQKKITTSSIITTEELGYLNGLGNNIKTELDNRYTKDETARIFVQQTQPNTGLQEDDLWFW